MRGLFAWRAACDLGSDGVPQAFEVRALAAEFADAADGPVPGDDHGVIVAEFDDAPDGGDPAAAGRSAVFGEEGVHAAEEQVAAVDDVLVGEVDDEVVVGVPGSEVVEHDRGLADADLVLGRLVGLRCGEVGLAHAARSLGEPDGRVERHGAAGWVLDLGGGTDAAEGGLHEPAEHGADALVGALVHEQFGARAEAGQGVVSPGVVGVVVRAHDDGGDPVGHSEGPADQAGIHDRRGRGVDEHRAAIIDVDE